MPAPEGGWDLGRAPGNWGFALCNEGLAWLALGVLGASWLPPRHLWALKSHQEQFSLQAVLLGARARNFTPLSHSYLPAIDGPKAVSTFIMYMNQC